MSEEHLPMTVMPAQTQVLSLRAIFRLTAVFMKTMSRNLNLQTKSLL